MFHKFRFLCKDDANLATALLTAAEIVRNDNVFALNNLIIL